MQPTHNPQRIVDNLDRRMLALQMVRKLRLVLDEVESDLLDGTGDECWTTALVSGSKALSDLWGQILSMSGPDPATPTAESEPRS